MARAAAFAVCLLSASAHAGKYYDFGEYATVGPLLSASASLTGARLGAGLEATYGRAISRSLDAGLGGFVQGQYVGDGAFEIAAGIQPTALIAGLELGAAYRTASSTVPAHGRLHVAPFISAFGFGSLALRFVVPVGAGASAGVEVGLGLTVKLAWHREKDRSRWRFMPNG